MQVQKALAAASLLLLTCSHVCSADQGPVVATATTHSVNYLTPADSSSLETQFAESGDNSYRITSGAVLIDTKRHTRVEAPHATVLAKPHSLIVVTAEQDCTKVLDLCDSSRGSVRVVLGDHVLNLAPGSGVTLINKNSPASVAYSDRLARRGVREVHNISHAKAWLFDFSIVHALSNQAPLSELKHSAERHHQRLLSRILKTAAAIALTTNGSRGPYRTGHWN